MNPNITIFGYVVNGGTLCPECFSTQELTLFKSILRSFHAKNFPQGLECDFCKSLMFFPTKPDVPGVFQEFIETLEF